LRNAHAEYRSNESQCRETFWLVQLEWRIWIRILKEYICYHGLTEKSAKPGHNTTAVRSSRFEIAENRLPGANVKGSFSPPF
jgi:hypothetical protein